MWVCPLGFVVLFWQQLHNSTQDVVVAVTLSQLAGVKDQPKNDPTTIKTQLYPETQHNQYKENPKIIGFRRSKRLLKNLTGLLP